MSANNERIAALLPAAQSGDARAMNEILALIHPPVLAYARARIGGGKHPTPEDVAQEVCLAVVKNVQKYEDRGMPFMAFVYGIASHKVADVHRTYQRDVAVPTEEVPETEIVLDTPESFALMGEGSNRVVTLLDSLSEKAREIIILRVFAGYTAEETAEIVGSTPGAVRVAQHRALARLRNVLEQEQD